MRKDDKNSFWKLLNLIKITKVQKIIFKNWCIVLKAQQWYLFFIFSQYYINRSKLDFRKGWRIIITPQLNTERWNSKTHYRSTKLITRLFSLLGSSIKTIKESIFIWALTIDLFTLYKEHCLYFWKDLLFINSSELENYRLLCLNGCQNWKHVFFAIGWQY